MKDIGKAVETPNNTFAFYGILNGTFVCVYRETIKGTERLVFKTPENDTEKNVVLDSISRMSEIRKSVEIKEPQSKKAVIKPDDLFV